MQISPADMHTHSYYSPDSAAKPKAMADAAKAARLSALAICDHIDLYDTIPPDFLTYFEELNALRRSTDIDIIIGVEAGWDRESETRTASLLSKFPFEYVINSVHFVNGSNPYEPQKHYKNGKERVYKEYLEAIIGCLNAPYRFDALGHLGYIERNAPYADNAIDYPSFKMQLDKIIDTAIKREIIIEYNTAHPYQLRADFLRAYKTAGGRLVALSSDAHTPYCVGRGFADAVKILKQTGFDAVCSKKSGRLTFTEI